MASSSNVPTMNLTHGEKPEKFNGNEFKRWQQKMLFYLTTLNLARFLHEECPILEEGETNKEKVAVVDAWKHSDFLCRNYVLNGLDNTLYNVYCSLKTAKELWDSLDKKYKTENAGMKKFIVGKFLDFKMIDSKTVISQVQELQVILHEIHYEGMSLSDSFQVAANYLKHKRKEMNLEELIVRLRIEEDNRKSEKKGNNSMEAKANVIEQGPKTNKKRKHGDQNQNQGSNVAKKFKGKCYNCGKTGHKSNDCRKPKKEKKPQANVTEFDKLSNDVSEMNLSAVVSECNIVGNTKEWWVDTGATRHICSNKWMFSTYKPVEQNEELFMGNSSSSKVEGQLTLNDVLHVPDIRKNLVSGSLLSKNGFKLVFVSDKFVLTKNEMFVGKGYLSDGLFKMNVMTVVPKSINNNKIDSYATCLRHVNYDTLRRLIHLDYLPKFNIDPNHKCETCVESKLTKVPFHSVERSTEPLDLIHSDICDLKFVQTRGGKKYFITFIDDCTRYCYVYLLKSKDEAIEMFKHYKNEVENQLSKKIKAIRSDRGGEYESRVTTPYSPKQNGVVRGRIEAMVEMARSMMKAKNLSNHFWANELLHCILAEYFSNQGGVE
ncbi:hypothetical protein AAG906_000090 [Vitis piasezkii]